MVKKWVVTVWLADEDENGEELNWTKPYEDYYVDTHEEAEALKKKFLDGRDWYYGNLVEDCEISDVPLEVELW